MNLCNRVAPFHILLTWMILADIKYYGRMSHIDNIGLSLSHSLSNTIACYASWGRWLQQWLSTGLQSRSSWRPNMPLSRRAHVCCSSVCSFLFGYYHARSDCFSVHRCCKTISDTQTSERVSSIHRLLTCSCKIHISAERCIFAVWLWINVWMR